MSAGRRPTHHVSVLSAETGMWHKVGAGWENPKSGAITIRLAPFTDLGRMQLGDTLIVAPDKFADEPRRAKSKRAEPAIASALETLGGARRCESRESGGVQCEREAGHDGEHACPEAAAQALGGDDRDDDIPF